MLDPQKLAKIDHWIVISLSVLLAAGLVAVYSATHSSSPELQSDFAKQVIWLFLGIVMFIVFLNAPIKWFKKYAYIFYAVSLVLLGLVLVFRGAGGVHRWFMFGPLRIQPSELAKVATILALARYVATDQRNISRMRELAVAFAIVLVPMLLVIKQPDLGTALVFLALILPVLYWAGLSLFVVFLIIAPMITLVAAFTFKTFFIAMIGILAILFISRRGLRVIVPNFLLNIGVGIITPLMWAHLRGYQKSRILTFLGLEQDPRGLGYQVLQSKVAIGSGGFAGKGWQHGTQTQLRFLPEQHTDFIFSVIGEEFGFIAITIVLLCFFILLWRAFSIAKECRSAFSSYLVVGASIVILFQVLVNTGMTVGMMPVTGLPLPFLSYGGSSLITSMILVAMILNAGRNRYRYV